MLHTRADDVDIDLPAVMGSRERLWSIYGSSWGWPPGDMTRQLDYENLAHHELEIENHESFNYALLNADESALFGCIYIDPSADVAVDAEVSWWVVYELVGTEIEAELDDFVPRWLRGSWPLEAVTFPLDQAPTLTDSLTSRKLRNNQPRVWGIVWVIPAQQTFGHSGVPERRYSRRFSCALTAAFRQDTFVLARAAVGSP
ncbi:MAG: hypothetical protein QOH55_927 [Microbacteriaceae bacterium]|nr:hypothetical protein [Microbacteriaceae bacterium]